MAALPDRPAAPRWLALPCGAGGAALLLLILLSAQGQALGAPAARWAAGILFVLLAPLALYLLEREGFARGACLVCLRPVAAALFLRVLCLDYVTPDYRGFLAQWAEYFRTHGGFAALSDPIGNYNVPYLYFLAAISYVDIPDLYLIKWFSCLFDILLAWAALRLAGQVCPAGSSRPLWCFCLVLLLPTVVLNGACWGQCDSVYTALTLLALSFALDQRGKTSVVLLALAFSFKLQTVFLLPLWCALWFTRRLKFRHLLLFPAVYLLTCVPALLAGRPLGSILSVYLGQMGVNDALTFNAPTVFSLLPYYLELDSGVWAKAAIAAAFALVLVLLGVLFRLRARATDETLLTAGVILAIGVPFLLPYMHDRYFFPADVLTLAWACARPCRAPWCAAVQCASLSAYCTYLLQRFMLPILVGGQYFTMAVEALLMLAALIAAWAALRKSCRAPEGPAL